jgi:putative nucleotidyltransferase with HDIG domain
MPKWGARRSNAAVAVADEKPNPRTDRHRSSHTSGIDVAALLAELPMQQAAMSRALVVLDDPNAGATEIAAVLESDPALCARVLQLANSAHFGMSGRVTSVDQAVVALGGTAMRTLVISNASGMFGKPEDLPPGFWSHSVSVAASSAIAARMYSVPRGDAICAGLMHDLGVALLFRHDRAGYEALMATGAEATDTLLDHELTTYGGDHAALGADALEAWKLPATIVAALRSHHDDPNAITDRLGRVVIAGESLARAALDPPAFAHEPGRDPAKVFAALGVRVASIDALIERAAEEANILAAMLGNADS